MNQLCEHCGNNFINGGSGFCNCTLPYVNFTTPIYPYKKPEPIQPFIGGTFRVVDDELFEIVDGFPPEPKVDK